MLEALRLNNDPTLRLTTYGSVAASFGSSIAELRSVQLTRVLPFEVCNQSSEDYAP